MKLGRRKFFGLAAGAAVGGKKVATDVLAEMVVAPSLPPPHYMRGLAQAGSAIAGGSDYLGHLQGQAVKMAAMKAVGIPPLLREVMRQWAGQEQQTNFDDINALVSVSVSAKKRMIREKMEDQMINDWFDRPARDLKRELFNKEFGVGL